MFSLVITIISIGLVVILALATLYYGGLSFLRGRAESVAASAINQGQQISGAYTLYRGDHEGVSPTRAQIVDDKYLKAWPELNGTTWRPLAEGSDTVWLPASVTAETCAQFNKKINGTDGVPAKPTSSWSKQCFGFNNEFSILWGASTSTVLADITVAVTNTRDTLNTTVSSALTPVATPGTGNTDNTWTVNPTTTAGGASGNTNLIDGSPLNPGGGSSGAPTLTLPTGQWSASTLTFDGNGFIDNNGSPLQYITVFCPAGGYQFGSGYPVHTYEQFSIASNKKVTINLAAEPLTPESPALSGCIAGAWPTMELQYMDGSTQQINYAIPTKISTTNMAPTVAAAVTNMQSLFVFNTPTLTNHGTNLFGVWWSKDKAPNLSVISLDIMYYNNCANPLVLSSCNLQVIPNSLYSFQTGSGNYYTVQQGITGMPSWDVNTSTKGMVRLRVVDENTGKLQYIFKEFEFADPAAASTTGIVIPDLP